jgi:ABC-type amino acid transport substrate-binding protein
MDEVLITTRTDVSDWILEGELLSREGYGVMMLAGELDLKAAVDGVIAAMRADGRLAAMMKRHRIREAASGPAGLGCPE